MIDPASAFPLLRELDDALALEGAEVVEWIVCGGTALSILGLIARPTRDVDVISEWNSTTLQIVAVTRFSPQVERAIDRVAAAHPALTGSGMRWVNLGPSGLLKFGLPTGCTSRLHRVAIGARLTLHVPSRLDLIAFKLLASIEATHSRREIHKADFRSFEPTEAELRFAIDWVSTIPDQNHQLRAELREFLHELGHDDLAYSIA